VSIEGTEVANNTDGEIAQSTNPALVSDASGNLVLNSANVQVHVTDEFGNDLPDYEVVYTLEYLGTTINGYQGASNTYFPIAYLADLDATNNIVATAYDANGTRPDSNEPRPASDPFATIVGAGGTPAFFFNQWLGAGPSGSASNVAAGVGGPYVTARDASGNATAWNTAKVKWPTGRVYNGNFSMYQTMDASLNVTDSLVTDGAKAWTLDGFAFGLGDASANIVPNLLTGSNIDIQLAQNLADWNQGATHFKSVLKIMVYAPAAGLVTDQFPIWEQQVHKTWVAPVYNVALSPASNVVVADGSQQATVTATVTDQFGNPAPNQVVTFAATTVKGANLAVFGSPTATTNAAGVAQFSWTEPTGAWGVQSVTAATPQFGGGTVTSSAVTVDWALNDIAGTYVSTTTGQSTAVVRMNSFAVNGWFGSAVRVYLTPGGTLVASGTYVGNVDLSMPATLPSTTWTANQGAYFNFAPSGTAAPNWAYTRAL